MIPSFFHWMENEESPLAGPQHKRGEGGMKLDAIIERRMRQIIMELESSGKGTQEEILTAVQKYLSTKGVKATQAAQPQSQTQQEPVPDQQSQPGEVSI